MSQGEVPPDGRTGRKRPAWTPLPTHSSAPTPVRASLDQLAKTLGMNDVDSIRSLFLDWPSIVGSELATHCRPQALRDGVLTVEAGDRQWATELHWMRSLLVERCCAALGPDAVVEVRILR